MTKKHQDILQKICEERGHVKNYGKCFHMIAAKLDQILTKPYREMLILGFLNQKETLIAVFGEEEVCQRGHSLIKKEAVSGDYLKCLGCGTVEVGDIYSYQYHHAQSGYSWEEKLDYIGKFWEGEK